MLLWSQSTDWEGFERSAIRIDELGYDHLWTWDQLDAIFGDPYQPIVEGYATLAAWATVTKRTRLALRALFSGSSVTSEPCAHCEAVGRDPSEIFHTFIAEMAAPSDHETLERWIGEVRPMVDGG